MPFKSSPKFLWEDSQSTDVVSRISSTRMDYRIRHLHPHQRPRLRQLRPDAGVAAVVQPGGSVRDDEVIAAADAAGITMYLTGTRHFWH